MFKLFKRNKLKTKEDIDFSTIAVDLHSHLIPGVDDGSCSLEETLDALRGFKKLGYKKIITTPHIMESGWVNTKSSLLHELEKVKSTSAFKDIDIQFDVSAEYKLDEGFEKILINEDFLVFGDNNILVETSMQHDFEFVREYIFELKKKGFNPIFAHPERYRYIITSSHPLDIYESWKSLGLMFQLNMFALIGIYGDTVQKTAEMLIEYNMYDFVSSDLHQAGQLNMYSDIKKNVHLEALIKSGHLKNKSLL